jgi:hypothetical protein
VVTRLAGGLSWVALSAMGCVSLSSVQTADTLGAGRLQLGIEPGVAGLVDPSTRAVAVSPAADFSVRYGALDRLDLGARLGQSGLELQAKLMVTPRSSPFIVSFAPHLAGQLRVDSRLAITGQIINLGLPLLLGLRLGRHQLILGPRLHVLGSLPADRAEPARRVLAVGGSIGLSIRISSAVQVLPELALVAPLEPQPLLDRADTFSQLTGGVLAQARLGFLIGGASP